MKIAFTSCMDAEHNADQPVWGAIQAQDPDVLLLLGDQIYMDWGLALANVPAIKKKFDRDPQEASEAFSEEMYARYRSQWGVPSFRRCVNSMADRSRILMAWDDHDFAWNDAYGDGADDRGVPQRLKNISAALAAQFLKVVRTAPVDAEYPALDLTQKYGFRGQQLELDGLAKLILFDQRWSRKQRDETDARLMCDEDRELLMRHAAAPGELLIVAGSSPMKHGYLLAHQGWWANANPKETGNQEARSYPEYMAFVEAARLSQRPILYLGGDIHRNAYGGPVEPGSSIVQVLSSGAALGRLLFRTFPRCFGTVKLNAAAGATSVDIALFTGDGEIPKSCQLFVQNNRWKEPPREGECSELSLDAEKVQDTEAHLDQRELSVLCYRERGRHRRNDDDLTLKASELDAEAFIDALPLKENSLTSIDSLRDWPEPVRVSGGTVGIRVQRLRGGNNQVTRVSDDMEAACRTAQATSSSVVLFIHGFNKTFSTSINQACELRERFDCVPLLYSWPSGGDGGLWATLGGFGKSQKTAIYGHKGLNAAIGQLALVAHGVGVKAVVLARSMGAEALRNAVVSGALNGAPPGAFSRVILSAPASPLRDSLSWLRRFQCDAVVTINRNDQKLKYADVIHNGKLLGHLLPDAGDLVRGVTYLDCTDAPGVDRSHDYLIRRISEPMFALNRAMIRGEGLGAHLNVPGLKVYSANAA